MLSFIQSHWPNIAAGAVVLAIGLTYQAWQWGWVRLPSWGGSKDDRDFDAAFKALDTIQATGESLKSDRVAELCGLLAEELTHAYYPLRRAT